METKISIVLTTYKSNLIFLEKQLNSIRFQTYNTFDVIIIDDCSGDGTEQFLNEYIKKYELCSWYVFILENNVGYKKAFKKGLEIAYEHNPNGIVFMADHDDIWIESKIERMSNIIINNKNILLLGGNSIPIDKDDNIITDSFITYVDDLKKIKKEKTLYKFTNETLLKGGRFQGCVSCLRSELIPVFLEHFTNELPHDYQLNIAACFRNGLFYLNECVIKYRLHSGQQIGCGKGPGLQTKEGRVFQVEEMLDFYSKISNFLKSYNIQNNFFNKYRSYYEVRKKVLLTWNKIHSFFWIIFNSLSLVQVGLIKDFIKDFLLK
ncbi:MAG: glycosyltransferase [Treponema sp.]|nr:glycosyltransferase [Treponema sp.]